ncbi:MAG: hypothetical protein AAGI51_08970 [Pseudomonadota bacterium]
MGSITRMIAAATAFTLAATAASATTYTVKRETGNGTGVFDVVGSITAFDFSSTSPVDFYHYGDPYRFSYNGPSGAPGTQSNEAISFLVETSQGLSFVTVLDAQSDGSGGEAKLNVQVGGATPGAQVSDDVNSARGEFTLDSSTADGVAFAGDFVWANCCTDGFMLGGLDGSWHLLLDFIELSDQRGLGGWDVISADGSSVAGLFSTEDGRALKIAPIPVPAGVLLIGTAFALAGAARRASRSA